MWVTTILFCGARDGAQPTEAKYLLGKREDLVQIPTDYKAVFICNPSVGEAKTGSWISLAGQPRHLVSSKFNETLFQKMSRRLR